MNHCTKRQALSICGGVLLLTALSPSLAHAQACYNYTTTYATFQASNFSSLNGAQLNPVAGPGTVQMVAGALAMTPESIILPFDQEVKVRFLNENSANSGTLGWFYYDQISGKFVSGGALTDIDGDGVKDWFQPKKAVAPTRANDGLFLQTAGVPMFTIGTAFTDGTPFTSPTPTFPRIPNVIELIFTPATPAGFVAFKISDDDADLFTANQNGAPSATPQLTDPVVDGKADVAGGDGIPDYDVDGNGVINGPEDKIVNLGMISGGREIVLFYNAAGGTAVNGNWTVYNSAVGLGGAGTPKSPIMPYFSKSILNPDSYNNGWTAGATIRTVDVACPQGTTCSANPGWMGNTALRALNGGALPASAAVRTVAVTSTGGVPHVLYGNGAVTADPNRWIVGWADSPIYKPATAPCAACSNLPASDYYNDAIFQIDQVGGGGATTPVFADIPVAELPSSSVSRIHFTATATFPAPCPAPTSGLGEPQDTTRVDFYYSVDNGRTWRPIQFAKGAAVGTANGWVDVLGGGQSNNQVRWRAGLVTTTTGCQPQLASAVFNYQVIHNAPTAGQTKVFKASQSVPIANLLAHGEYETPSSSWTVSAGDLSLRGHFNAQLLYTAISPSDKTASNIEAWSPDAGGQLAARNPDARKILFNNAGAANSFVTTAGAQLAPLVAAILPPTTRAARRDGGPAFDLNKDGVADDLDAQWIVQWTRGWETPATVQRAWKLGAIVRSSPAIIGPPSANRPLWLFSQYFSPPQRDAYDAFAQANGARGTVAVVGAQDGMLHAFDMGKYSPATDSFTLANYGTGSELWGFVPQSQTALLKNNLPSTTGYTVPFGSLLPTDPLTTTRAAADGSMTYATVYRGGNFGTVVVAPLGRTQPFMTGLDVTDVVNPVPLWATDWTDPTFQGTEWSVAIAPVLGSTPPKFLIATASGLAQTPGPEYVYLIDLATGTTVRRIQLVDNANIPVSGLGVMGSPILADSDGDYLADRMYIADTSGRLFRININTFAVTLLNPAGPFQTIFAPITADQSTDNPPVFHLYVAGADNPETNDAVGSYSLVIYTDDPVSGTSEALRAALPAGYKAWAGPAKAGDTVFVAVSYGDLADVCSIDPTRPPQILGWNTPSLIAGNGGSYGQLSTIQLAAGSGQIIGRLGAYDSHLVAGTTTGVLGASGAGNSTGAATQLMTQTAVGSTPGAIKAPTKTNFKTGVVSQTQLANQAALTRVNTVFWVEH